ncbi:hypothetical protein [Pseudomonas chlororaphis]|uniref:hypothetical protein n=1 Tax=Pseudomonas chlororaphis TaxID=587753 RepID=UPI001B30307F|nr:hypothetical protein [Pseudomonas chlororaphis]MBP5054356.1 hypothetical protein [Pseudomonas chlororaphis]MBP5137487.1 hypothetical protein [Pseudomonas chlororaphis]QTT99533.1 hypothetical protein HUT26_09690 [Pseudomonas chlororaphis]
MKPIILSILLLVAGQVNAGEQVISVQHDSQRGVTCWILNGVGISCLPDSQLQNQPTLAPEQDQDGPTPAAVPLQRQHKETFQL